MQRTKKRRVACHSCVARGRERASLVSSTLPLPNPQSTINTPSLCPEAVVVVPSVARSVGRGQLSAQQQTVKIGGCCFKCAGLARCWRPARARPLARARQQLHDAPALLPRLNYPSQVCNGVRRGERGRDDEAVRVCRFAQMPGRP